MVNIKMIVPFKNGVAKTGLRLILAGFVLLPLLAGTGCFSVPDDVSAGLGEQISLSIGQNVSITGEELGIQFIGIVSDSRCPTGATCIWQGEVTAVIDIDFGGTIHRKSLIEPGLTGTPSMSDFQEYRFTYSVKPYPALGTEIRETDYRLEITVERRYSLTGGVLVTFDVLGQQYSVFVTDSAAIEQVLAVQRGENQAKIPSGRLVAGSVPYNEPWSWHIDPVDIHMAEVTIELCDGTPQMVEDNLDYWLQSVQRFCPWAATIVTVRDFR
jgi:hypothetical protein